MKASKPEEKDKKLIKAAESNLKFLELIVKELKKMNRQDA